MRSPAATAVLLLLAFGCGADGGPGDGAELPRDGRVTSWLRSTVPPPAPPRVLAELAPTETSAPWTASAPDGARYQEVYSSDLRDADAPRIPATLLLGRGAREVSLELPADGVNAARALVGAYLGERAEVAARWERSGEVVGRSAPVRLTCRGTPHLVTLRGGVAALEADTLVLELGGPCDAAALCRLELLRSTPGDDVPHPPVTSPLPVDAPFVTVGTELRRGYTLIEGRPLVADVNAPGESFRLSVAWPARLREEAPPRLVASWTPTDGAPTRWSVELPAAATGPTPAWAELRLGPRSAGDGRLELSLVDASDATTAACLVADVRAPSAPGREPRPSIVLVTSDTHRGDHVGYATGDAPVATPNLDRLAARGLAFLDAHSTTNVTNPAHVALMTGLHPRDTRIVDNGTRLAERAETLAERFAAAGYRTFAAVSAQHLEPRQSGLGQGFDRFDAPRESKRHGRVALDAALRWLDEAEGEPVFLWLHLFDPHAPYSTDGPRASRARVASPLVDAELPSFLRSPWMEDRDAEGVRSLYRGEVETVDDLVGRMLGHAALEDAVVAFTSDHGEALGDNQVWFSHAGARRANLHVPLVVAGPGVDPIGPVDTPVVHSGLARTLLRLAGVVDPDPPPGQDLASVARGEGAPLPRFALGAFGESAAIASEGWLLVLHLREHQRHGAVHRAEHGEVELYDLDDDPLGLVNVVDDHPARASRLRRALVRWLANAVVGGGLGAAVTLDAGAAANLEALGYGGGAGATEGAWWRPDPDAPWVRRFEERPSDGR